MQVQFMVYAFGGSAEYKGKDLKAAHYHLVKTQGLNTGHFDMVAGHFKDVLLELGVAEVGHFQLRTHVNRVQLQRVGSAKGRLGFSI